MAHGELKSSYFGAQVVKVVADRVLNWSVTWDSLGHHLRTDS